MKQEMLYRLKKIFLKKFNSICKSLEVLKCLKFDFLFLHEKESVLLPPTRPNQNITKIGQKLKVLKSLSKANTIQKCFVLGYSPLKKESF